MQTSSFTGTGSFPKTATSIYKRMQHLRNFLLAALLLLSATVAAQEKFYLEPRLGFGTFRMASMKELQQTVIRETGVNAKAVDTFGPYFQFGVGLVRDLDEETRLGLFAEHGSTGGRVAYEDYSGEFMFDTPVSYHALGASLYSHQPIKESGFSLVAGIEANIFFSELKIETHARLYEDDEASEDKFNSIGFGLKPSVGLQYPLYSLPVRLSVGYMASASKPFHVPGEPDYQLRRNNASDSLEPSWSGLRISLTVSVPIFN